MLTTRHSCVLLALSKGEESAEKRSVAANPFRIRSFVKHARNPFRMRTFKIQDLKPFRMCSSEKTGGGGGWGKSRTSNLARFRRRQVPVLPCRLHVQSISEAAYEV